MNPLDRSLWIALFMGFYSGLPLLLTGSLLQAWMRESGVDLTTIGLFALVGLPYTLKFLWAPLFDRYTPLAVLGRRRSWLLISQLFLAVTIFLLGQIGPAHLPSLAAAALSVAFLSASQDIAIDAYRRESLEEREQGLGASLYVNGYRLALLLVGGGGLILADLLAGFPPVYTFFALLMGSGLLVTLWAREPDPPPGTPKSLSEAVFRPLTTFLQRPAAAAILAFILLYKVGDTMASQMAVPFYLDLGFSKTEIGAVAKLFGFWATVIGGLLGGGMMLKIGIYRALWWFGILQAVSTAAFAWLATAGPLLQGLVVVIAFENLASGMGTAAFIAFMAALTDRRFTATQYALLSSLMGVPRVLLAAPTGWLAEQMGWTPFFLFCALAALPGLMLLFFLKLRLREDALL